MIVYPSNRTGHPQPLLEPPITDWPSIAAENNRRITDSKRVIGGQPLHRLRALARREALDVARAFTARSGLPVDAPLHSPADHPLVVTGHQPTLFSTGVWSKYFALSQFAKSASGIGIDLIIDSDRAAPIAVDIPSLGGRPGIESTVLSPAHAERYFGAVPTPSRPRVDSFGAEVFSALRQLPYSGTPKNFEAFLSAVMRALPFAANMAELMAFTRRHFEAPAGLFYLQLPVTELSETVSFRIFAADIITKAEEFAAAYNQELRVFRAVHRVRSEAQPVPDLRSDNGAIELPFWLLLGGARRRVFVRSSASAIEIFTHEGDTCVISANTDELLNQLSHVKLAPKALALTMYSRLFLADMFIHGTGGARYDSVTDGILRRFYRLDAPHFAVVSVPAIPPFAIDEPSLAPIISAAQERLKTLKHHPEIAIQTWLSDPERPPARDLMEIVSQKRRMVGEISRPGADRAFLGAQIRQVNEKLQESLHDEISAVEDELTGLRSRAAQATVLSDRRYPYCFFDPREYSQMFDSAVL